MLCCYQHYPWPNKSTTLNAFSVFDKQSKGFNV